MPSQAIPGNDGCPVKEERLKKGCVMPVIMGVRIRGKIRIGADIQVDGQ